MQYTRSEPDKISYWHPGDLGVLRRVADGVAEEARTRGFASPALAGFAFIVETILHLRNTTSILECAYSRVAPGVT